MWSNLIENLQSDVLRLHLYFIVNGLQIFSFIHCLSHIVTIVWVFLQLQFTRYCLVIKFQLTYFPFVACCRYICHEEWASNIQNYYYTLALLTLQFLIPLTVLIFTYTRIACAVWGKRPPGEAENSRDQRMARSKRKVSDEAPCFNTWILHSFMASIFLGEFIDCCKYAHATCVCGSWVTELRLPIKQLKVRALAEGSQVLHTHMSGCVYGDLHFIIYNKPQAGKTTT